MKRDKRERLIAFRATDHDAARMNELKQKTGLTASEVLRQLIHTAELRPSQTLRPVAHLNSDAGSYVLADPAGISR